MAAEDKRTSSGMKAAAMTGPGSGTPLDVLKNAGKGLGKFNLKACMNCGLCADACHIYRIEPEIENLPAFKAGKLSKLYRRHCTPAGRLMAWLKGDRGPARLEVDGLDVNSYGRCTVCGRCNYSCPVGVDIASIIRIGRFMCVAAEQVPEGLQRTVDNQIETGNQMAIAREEFLSTCEWLGEELGMEIGDDKARIHVDGEGSRVLYMVNPREIKFFPLSLQAAAGIFHAAGESWTISSTVYDVTNYGFYSGDAAAARVLTRRMLEEAERLGVKEVILSECGHGFRSFRWEGPRWLGAKYPFRMRSVLELIEEYLDSSRIKTDKSKNKERVTLHDPCNLVRKGGIVEPQRRILRQVCSDFVEMTPSREHNYCCGGGGGMLSMSEFGSRRVKSGKVKADQIRATGAKIVACPCHNCADQLIELDKVYKLGVEIQSVGELVYNALIWPGRKD